MSYLYFIFDTTQNRNLLLDKTYYLVEYLRFIFNATQDQHNFFLLSNLFARALLIIPPRFTKTPRAELNNTLETNYKMRCKLVKLCEQRQFTW